MMQRVMKRLVVAIAVLLAATGAAHAEPVTLSILSALAITGWSATAVSALTLFGSLALSFGLSYAASKLLGPKPQQDVGGVELDLRVDANVPQSLLVGRAVTAGSLVYAETYGQRGDIDNSDLVQIIAIADHPVTGLVSIFVEDQEVTTEEQVGGSPGIVWGVDAEARGLLVTGYDGNLAVQFYDGSQTAADPLAVAALSAHPERPWTSAMIGRGTCYARWHAIFEQEKMAGPPRTRYVVDGIKLYDPRKDSSVGGSGAHRFGTLSTHEFSANLILILYNVLRGIRVADADGVPQHFFGLENVAAASLPLDNWFAAMNEADVVVGGEPQYHGGMEIGVDSEPLEVIKRILIACDARLTEVGGVYKIYVGAPGLPVFTMDDGLLRADEGDEYDPILPLTQRVNYVTGTYTAPNDGWVPKVAPPRGDAAYEVEDGRRLEADLNLPLVQSGSHMQRLQKQMLLRSRRERRHLVPLPPYFYGIEPGDVIEWDSVLNGYDAKLFEVDHVDEYPNLDLVVSMIEVDPADYDWTPETDLVAEPTVSLVVARPSPKVIVGFDAEGFVYTGDLGTQYPAIRITWTDPKDNDATAVRWQLRVAADLSNETSGTYDDVAAGQVVVVGGLQSATAYQVRARFESFSGYPADWSLWISVTTPETFIVAGQLGEGSVVTQSIADGSVVTAKLAAQAVDATKFAAGIEPVALATGSLPNPSGYTGPKTVLFDGEIYRYSSGAWTKAIAAADVSGQLSDAQIAAIAAAKITGQVVSSQIADAAIVAAKLAAAAVDATKFAAGIEPVSIVSATPNPSGYAGPKTVLNTTDGKLYRYVSGAWTVAAAAADVTGQLVDSQIAAIAAAKITGTVVSAQIADAAITTAKLAAAAVDATKFASGIEPVSLVTSVPSASGYTGPKTILNTADGRMYRYISGAWTSTPAVEVTGQLADAQLAAIAAAKVTGQLTDAQISALAAAKVTGQITTTQIADSGITTPKIAAGAVVAASIAAGEVTTAKLAVGTGANMLYNSDGLAGLKGWEAGGSAGTPSVFGQGWDVWTPPGMSSGYVNYSGSPDGTYCDISLVQPKTDGGYQGYIVVPGQRYEFSAYISAHRTAAATVSIGWFDAAGGFLGAVTGQSVTSAGGGTLDNWGRSHVFGTAPATAASVWLFARATFNGQANPYMFVAAPYFGPANPNQSEPTPWSLPGATVIDGAQIVTASIVAGNIAAGAITTAKIAAGAITANEIAAATITGSNIAAATITASNLVANTITAGVIAAGAIGTTQLAAGAVTTSILAAGAVTAGTIASGTITSTQIAANTIVAGNIAAGTITTTEIAAGTIVASDIAAATITGSNIAAATIAGSNIIAGTITASQIASATITAGLIAAGAIGTTQLAAGSVTTSILAAGAVVASKLAIVPEGVFADPYADESSAWNGDSGGWYFEDESWPRSQMGERRGILLWSGIFSGTGRKHMFSPFRTSVLNANVSYRTSLRVRNDSNQNIGFGIEYFDSASAYVGGSYALDKAPPGFNGTATFTITPSASCTFWRLVIFNEAPGSAFSGIVGVTNLRVQSLTGTTLIEDGAITTDKIVAGAVTAAKITAGTITANEIAAATITGAKIAATTIAAANIVSGTITASQMAANTITAGVIAAGAIGTTQLAAGAVTTAILAAGAVVSSKIAIFNFDNLVPNGDFSDGIVGWVGNTTTVSASGNTHSGAGALLGTRTIGDQYWVQSWPGLFPVAADSVYELSAWIYPFETSAGSTVYLEAYYYDAAGSYLGQLSSLGPFATPAGWSQISGQVTTTASARKCSVVIRIAAGSGSILNLFVDDIVCRKAGGVTYIEDGAITTAKLVAGSVTTTKIAAGAITANEIAANAIVAGKIAAGAINAASIIVDNLVVTGHLSTGAAASDGYVSWSAGTSAAALGQKYLTTATGEVMVTLESRYVKFSANSSTPPGQGSVKLYVDDTLNAEWPYTLINVGGNNWEISTPMTLRARVTGLSNASHKFEVFTVYSSGTAANGAGSMTIEELRKSHV